MTNILLPIFVLAGMLTSSNAQSCRTILDRHQCNATPGCAPFFSPVLMVWMCRASSTNNLDFVRLDVEVEADRYDHSDFEYHGEETENIPSVGDEYDYYGSDEGDAPATLLLDHADGNDTWSDEPDSSRTIEEKHPPLHSEIKRDFSSHQKTRLRGSASRNAYFSAISVGDDSRPTRAYEFSTQMYEKV